MSTSGSLPPLENRTAGDGAFLVAFSYCLLVFAFVATGLRILVSWTQRRGFGMDDLLLILAIVSLCLLSVSYTSLQDLTN